MTLTEQGEEVEAPLDELDTSWCDGSLLPTLDLISSKIFAKAWLELDGSTVSL